MAEPADTTKMALGGVAVDSPMEEQVKKLAEKVWKKYQVLDESQRYLIGIAGIPGSGKSTFAASLAYRLNGFALEDYRQRYPNAPDYQLRRQRSNTNGSQHKRNWSDPILAETAFVVPMDGFHLTRAQLAALPNAEEAIFRRGAAFTFDADSYLKLIEKLRKSIEPGTRTIFAPSFDHAKKDPVEDDIAIPRSARIIIVEGLYTALCYEASKTESDDTSTKAALPSQWSEACALFDEIWLVEVPIPIATERVAKRNFQAGLSPTLEAAIDRTVKNDMRNAQEILSHLPPNDKLTERIKSIEDEGWKTEEQKMRIEDEMDKQQQEQKEHEMKRIRLERLGSIAEMVDAGAGM